MRGAGVGKWDGVLAFVLIFEEKDRKRQCR